jgi:hypothetical protein
MWWWGVALAVEGVFRPEVGTNLPLDLSVGALAEVQPQGGPALRLRGSVGWLPGAYLTTANDAAQALFADYTDPYRALVEAGLDNATVVRVHAGLRPAPRYGFYAHAGWTLIAAQGSATGSELVEAVTDTQLPPLADAVSIGARERVHFADVELGWEEGLGGTPLTLRVGLGWSFAVAARATLTPEGLPALPIVEERSAALVAEGEAEIEGATTDFVHPPTLAVALGWSFGSSGGRDRAERLRP